MAAAPGPTVHALVPLALRLRSGIDLAPMLGGAWWSAVVVVEEVVRAGVRACGRMGVWAGGHGKRASVRTGRERVRLTS